MDPIEEIASVYKAFSDPTRLKILKMLARGRCLCVNAIVAEVEVTQSAVSQHLRILRQVQLVRAERRSNRVHYSLDERRLRSFSKMVFRELGSEFA